MTVTLPVNCGGELTDAAAADVVAAEALAEPVEAADEPLLVVAAAEATLVVVVAALALALLVAAALALVVCAALLVAAELDAVLAGAAELLSTAVELPLAVAALPPPPQAASRATAPIPAAPCTLKMSRRRRLIPLTAIPFLPLPPRERTRPAQQTQTLGALQIERLERCDATVKRSRRQAAREPTLARAEPR